MSIRIREITSCEVCGNKKLSSMLDLGNHPMCDALVSIGDTRMSEEFPIEILFCSECRTAHQRFQIPKEDLFPQTYHYRARHTADVLKGMAQLVASAEEQLGELTSKKVVDIGCNDGSLLSIFLKKGAQTFGIEPTGAYTDAQKTGHEVMHVFFNEATATKFVQAYGRPDIVTFTNVFAHIEHLDQVIRALQILCHANTTIIIENHYFGSVLSGYQFDTFYHEHPRTYSYSSFVRIAESLGREVSLLQFPQRYGGNIRVFLQTPKISGKLQHDRWQEMDKTESDFGSRLGDMAAKIKIWRSRKRQQIEDAVRAHGKLVAKAFPGRAAILIKVLELNESLIAATYEKPQSGKIGHYIPGTRIPILSDDLIIEALPSGAPILNLAWHISDEIHAYVRQLGFKGEFIDIISSDDFSG